MRPDTWLERFKFYTIPSSFLNIRIGLGLLLFTLVLGTVGFMSFEGYDFGEAFYMTVITISTVGYTEVEPLTVAGRWFNSFYILLNIGIFAYVLAVFSYYVIQGEIFKYMHKNLIDTQIRKLQDHVVLCGYGRYGREIAAQFEQHGTDFVVIDIKEEEVEEIRKTSRKILYLHDDATQDEVLLEAGIKQAKGLVTALPDDSDNLFVVLSARQLNPELEIVSRVSQAKSIRKLRLAGADHVIMPEQIGGFYIATLMSKPEAVEFFAFITNEAQSDIGFEEIHFDTMPQRIRGKSIRELSIRKETGANIIGFKTESGEYIVNPGPETVLSPGTSFILLGDKKQLRLVREMCAIPEE